jgi:ABC-2 type transporter/CDR ABC transporter
MSDKLLLLTKGDVAYFGSTKEVIPYFRARGCVPPPQTSTSEWLLEELNYDFHQSLEHVQRLVASWQSSSEKLDLDQEVREFVRGRNSAQDAYVTGSGASSTFKFKRSLFQQSVIHARRSFFDAVRNPAVILHRFCIYLGLSALIGIGWYRVPSLVDRMAQITALLFFTIAFMVLLSIAVLPVYLNEKVIVTHERINGCYATGAYLVGHFLVEILYIGILSVAVSVVVYSLTGLNPQISRGSFFAFTIFVSLLTAESIMILIAAVVRHVFVGTAMATALFGAFMVVQGFLVHNQNIPWLLRWLQYIALHSYAFAALCINEFDGRDYIVTSNTFPVNAIYVPGKQFLASFNFTFNNKWTNIGVLVVMILVYRILSYIYISKFLTGKR